MPWGIDRQGSSLQIWIACPVDDWDALFDEVQRRLDREEGLTAIEMPTRIAGASLVDGEALGLLRRVLALTSGIPLAPPDRE
jgi:hypothetical protein